MDDRSVTLDGFEPTIADVRSQCPRPLDDRAMILRGSTRGRTEIVGVKARSPAIKRQTRRDDRIRTDDSWLMRPVP